MAEVAYKTKGSQRRFMVPFEPEGPLQVTLDNKKVGWKWVSENTIETTEAPSGVLRIFEVSHAPPALEIGSVTSGPEANASLERAGDTYLLHLVLPYGPQGPQGPQGAIGPRGPTGRTVTLISEAPRPPDRLPDFGNASNLNSGILSPKRLHRSVLQQEGPIVDGRMTIKTAEGLWTITVEPHERSRPYVSS